MTFSEMRDWSAAQRLVIGGTSLLSKRPGRYVTDDSWPTFFRSCSGIKVKALCGKTYLDFSEFSIGCNLFGYGNPISRSFILKYLFSSPLCTLISPLESELASALNSLIGQNRSWKFARGGGESMAQAVRIARAYFKSISLPNRIVVLGYHGWHDWYLSSNINDSDSLSSVFLRGLDPIGIPTELSNQVFPLNANDENFISLINAIKPSAIVFESARYSLLPSNVIDCLQNFQDNGCLLIADEITSCFRSPKIFSCFELGLNPDILVLGKSLGNGFAISALGITNRHRLVAEDCFMSSTFWGEEIGFTAAIHFISRYSQYKNFYSELLSISTALRDALLAASCSSGLQIKLSSYPTMIYIQYQHPQVPSICIQAAVNQKMLASFLTIQQSIHLCLIKVGILRNLATISMPSITQLLMKSILIIFFLLIHILVF